MMVNTGGGGPGGPGGMNSARLNIQLTPRKSRPVSASQIAQQFRQQFGSYPGFRAFVNVPAALQIGGFQGNSSYNLMVESLNNDELYKWAPRLEDAIAAIPDVQDVSDNMELKSPRINLVIDRDKAAAVGLNATQIENALNAGLGPRWSTTLYGQRAQYRGAARASIRNSASRLTAWSASRSRPRTVISYRSSRSCAPGNRRPAVCEPRGPAPGRFESPSACGPACRSAPPSIAINEAARRILPPTVTTSFQGSAKIFAASTKNLGLLLFVALGVVYIVLGMLYESYIHPLTIMSGLPSAGLGALVTLWLFGNELNIYSFVGLILLVGLVKKNAIMQIDFALEAERQHGKSPTEAIFEGCIIRFRRS